MLKLTEDLMTDFILFIVLVEQWKIAYLVKELLWWKKNKNKTKKTLAIKQHSPQVW